MQFLQVAKDKFKTVFQSNPPMFQIIVGRTREGNDKILTEYMDPELIRHCYWYHVSNDTSAHVVLYNNIQSRPTLNNYIHASGWIRQNLYKPVTKTGEKSILMVSKLIDVSKTNTLGLVHVKNEALINISNWEHIFKDNENNI
jgi:hypothetical protein